MISADLVILNGKVATVDCSFSMKEAISVKDGWIIDVGSDEEIRGYIGPDTKIIDLEGKVILPAANDAHMHAVHTGLKLRPGFIDAGYGVKSIKDIQDKIAKAVDEAKPGEWVYGIGFMDFMLKECIEEGRLLNRYDLDTVSKEHPVMLNDFGLHTLVVNSKALEIAGIHKDFRELTPEEGYIGRDSETGEPNGRFGEWAAQNLITKHCPVLSEKEMEECIIRVQRALNEQGITSHTDIVGLGGDKLFLGTWGERAIHLYEKMAREGRLTARVSCNIFSALNGVQSYDAVTKGIQQMNLPEFKNRNWVKADCIKIFGDGSTWLRKTSGNENNHGRSVFPGTTDEKQAEEIEKTIIELHRLGWQIGIHGIGGMTIDTAVNAFVKAQKMYPKKSLRHFVIHGDDMTLENAEQMAKYHIGCSPQPIAANIVAGLNVPVVTVKDELFNWQAYMDKGVMVAAGSDSSCFSLNWREGIQFAVTRTTIMGQEVRPELIMKLEDAIRMYTIEGAKQEHMEEVRGSIEVNKVADFQVLGENIFKVPLNEIGKIPVVMTICDGKIVYEKNK